MSAPTRPEAIALYNEGCTALGDGAYAAAASFFRRSLMIEPGALQTRYNLGAALERAGDQVGSIAVYRQCVAAHPDHMDSAYNLASLLADRGAYGEAAAILDDLRRRFPDENKLAQNYAIVAWRHRLGQEAARDAGRALPRILVACMPKSGSTFLADVLARLPGMQRAHLVPDYGRREQELDLEQLASHQGLSYVSQLHIRPSKLTHELLAAFGIRPLFLYRNIWDVMASLRDHMNVHSLDWSMAQIDRDFRGWDEARQYDFLARTMMPWFVDFYVGWSRAPDRLSVRYEELMADPVAVLRSIAAWAAIGADEAAIGEALAATGHSATFNKGGSGRGKAVPEAARAQVQAIAGFYPRCRLCAAVRLSVPPIRR